MLGFHVLKKYQGGSGKAQSLATTVIQLMSALMKSRTPLLLPLLTLSSTAAGHPRG